MSSVKCQFEQACIQVCTELSMRTCESQWWRKTVPRYGCDNRKGTSLVYVCTITLGDKCILHASLCQFASISTAVLLATLVRKLIGMLTEFEEDY